MPSAGPFWWKASKPPCCPILCPVPIVCRGEYDLTVELVSTSGNTCIHAHNHTSTPTHHPLCSPESKQCGEQPVTLHSWDTRNLHRQSFLVSLVPSHAGLGSAGPKTAALELTRFHPDLTGRFQLWEPSTHTVGTVGLLGTGTSGDMARLKCSKPASEWERPFIHTRAALKLLCLPFHAA